MVGEFGFEGPLWLRIGVCGASMVGELVFEGRLWLRIGI